MKLEDYNPNFMAFPKCSGLGCPLSHFCLMTQVATAEPFVEPPFVRGTDALGTEYIECGHYIPRGGEHEGIVDYSPDSDLG